MKSSNRSFFHNLLAGRLVPFAIGCALLIARVAQSAEPLEQRIAQRDVNAILQAADQNRTDLVSTLESIANDSNFAPWSSQTAARKALGRLGVKKYVDTLLKELTDPTNSEAYVYWRTKQFENKTQASYLTKTEALKSLGYIRDKSTVRAIVSELDDTNVPPSSPDVIYDTPALVAVWTLERMGLENAPVVDKVTSGDTRAEQEAFEKWMEQHPGQAPTASPEEHIAAWKKWWQQNKDKYP
jgi:predicted membrane-bound mannosyltransferase